MAALPDDLLLEILARVPDVAALFRCATACKQWRALVADPSFLHRQWPANASHRSFLLGYFARRLPPRGEEGTRPAPDPVFIPSPGSVLGPRLRSFVPSAAGLLDGAAPLTSRGGLLLVRLAPDAASDPPEPSIFYLAVCDPLAGTCHALPPLNCDVVFKDYQIKTWATALLTDGDCCNFKVLMVAKDPREPQYNLHTFVSGQPGWSAPEKCFNTTEHNLHWPIEISHNDAAVCRGTVCWLLVDSVDAPSSFYTLSVDIETGYISLRKLLIPVINDHSNIKLHYASRLSATGDGTHLSICFCNEGLQLQTWTRQFHGEESDDAAVSWVRTGLIEVKLREAFCMCLGERSDTMLLLGKGGGGYVADVRTGTMEKLPKNHRFLYLTVAMEIDWPAFFMSRLARRSVPKCGRK